MQTVVPLIFHKKVFGEFCTARFFTRLYPILCQRLTTTIIISLAMFWNTESQYSVIQVTLLGHFTWTVVFLGCSKPNKLLITGRMLKH